MFGRGEIRALTGVRGIAACLVVVYHLTAAGQGVSVGPLHAFIRHGYLAVDLFFVLSGMVMALNYGVRLRPGQVGLRAYERFLGSRLGRVYPLYLAATLACLALAAGGIGGIPVPSSLGVAANLLMVQAWGFAVTICRPGWSISAEFAAYLLLPGLLWFTASGGAVRAAAALLAVLAAYAVLGGLGTALPKNGPYDVYSFSDGGSLLRCLAGFGLGLLCHRAASSPPVWRLFRNGWVSDAIGAAVLALMALGGPDWLIVLLFGPFVIGLSAQTGMVSRLMATPPAMWLGLISYSIYLVHEPLIRVSQTLLAGQAGVVLDRLHASRLALALAILLLSAASYHLVERPARDLSRRWLGRAPLPPESEALSPPQRTARQQSA